MTGTDPAAAGDVLDIGAPEPPNVIGVESLTWADYGDGYGPGLADETDANDPEAGLLHDRPRRLIHVRLRASRQDPRRLGPTPLRSHERLTHD